jgi:hypothetical protein
MEIKITVEERFSLSEICRMVLEAEGSKGLAKLAICALKTMDCADTFAETRDKINKLPN